MGRKISSKDEIRRLLVLAISSSTDSTFEIARKLEISEERVEEEVLELRR